MSASGESLLDVLDCPTYIVEICLLTLCSFLWWILSFSAWCPKRNFSKPLLLKGIPTTFVEHKVPQAQELAPASLFNLPEAVQAALLLQAGPTAWRCAACSNRSHHQSLWSSSVIWKNALAILTEQTKLVQFTTISAEQEAGNYRDLVRREWFGIDNLCNDMYCGWRTAGAPQLRIAARACKGLQCCDGVELAGEVLSRCVKLLRTFDVDDAAARREAIELKVIIVARSDLFHPSQCETAEDALNEALQLHELLCEALRARERHLQLIDPLHHLDDDAPVDVDGEVDALLSDSFLCLAGSPSSSSSSSSSNSGAPEDSLGDALDKLLSVLHGSISDGLVTSDMA